MKTVNELLAADPNISDQLKTAITDRWLTRTANNAAVVSAQIDAERREAQHYMQEAFAGRDDDWIQWLTDSQKEDAIKAINKAVRQDPESALLAIRLLLSTLISECAKGHVARCCENGTL